MSLTAIGWTASLLQQPVTLARGLRVDGAVLLPASTHPPGTILPEAHDTEAEDAGAAESYRAEARGYVRQAVAMMDLTGVDHG